METKDVEVRGGARNFPIGADFSYEGAEMRFTGYYKNQKSSEGAIAP